MPFNTTEKQRDYFRKRRADPIRRAHDARLSKRSHLKRRYGVTLEAYEEFVKFCGNKCAICESQPSIKRKVLDLDHDHKLGHIRGLLCQRCNKVLGMVGENIELLQELIQYLINYKEVLEEQNAINPK